MLHGSPAGHLVIDNSGTIRADGGALQFDETIDWQCSGGSASFDAAAPAALILFAGPYRVETNAVSLFTGLGTNRLLAGGTIAGAVQVGAVDPVTQSFSAGNLDIADSVAGGGTLRALGNSSWGSAVSWDNGTLSLAWVTIDAGASLLLDGVSQISGCALTNSGLCTLLSQGLTLDHGAVINNATGGTFNVAVEAILSAAPGSAGSVFNNAGTFRKSSGGTTQFGAGGSSAGLDLNNTGLVDVQAGQLNILGGLSSGEFRTAAGAVPGFGAARTR